MWKMARILLVRLLTLIFVLNLICAVHKHSSSVGEGRVHKAATSDNGPATRQIPSNLQMDSDAAYLPGSEISSPVMTISSASASVANDSSHRPGLATPIIAVSSIVKRQRVFRI